MFDYYDRSPPRELAFTVRTITALSAIAPAIDVDAAKLHMRVDGTDEDSLIADQVKAAQEKIEAYTAKIFSPRTLELVLDAFPCLGRPISIPRAPVTSIVSVKYTGSDGLEHTVDPSGYRWSDIDPTVLLPAFNGDWPVAVACDAAAVRIRFDAGYAAGEVPSGLISALKRMTTYLYENREGDGDLPPGVLHDCERFRRSIL